MSKKHSKYSYSPGYTPRKSASSFWYDEYNYDYNDYLSGYGGYTSKVYETYKKTNDLYKLASVRRAIANFVQIVTGKSIPVTYMTKSDSYTDGERVVLSADVNDNFDVSVGLALHEGSHIVLSDFKLLAVLAEIIKKRDIAHRSIKSANEQVHTDPVGLELAINTELDSQMKVLINRVGGDYKDEMRDIFLSTGRLAKYGEINSKVTDTLRGLTNWIEDRRIDRYIYNSAPGYRAYYTNMYDHYFNDKAVTKGIDSDEFTTEDVDSYMFRIINFLNEKTDLSKLKGLRKIYRMLDLKNIGRLQTSKDSLQLAIEIMEVILSNTGTPEASETEQSGKGSASDENAEVNVTNGSKDDSMGGMDGNIPNMVVAEAGDDSPAGANNTTPNKLSPTALKQLLNKFDKQKKFLNGDIKKKNVTKEEINKLQDIAESETELVRVGVDGGSGSVKGVDCIVVKKITDRLIKSKDFPFSRFDWASDEPKVWAEDEVKRGITLGTLLGRKLQLRGESRETIFSRLKKGKIDKRMISALGYDNDSVFYTNEIDQYKKANLHISLDYSGSMGGNKLRKTIVSVVAIVKACQMARNLNVQVSIRSTDSGSHGKSLPYIAVVYDSRNGNFRQFCKYMSILECNNTTPEGLCFEAIMKQLMPTDNSIDSYFLNFSDGSPCYSIHTKTDNLTYSGEFASKHTNRQVKKMREMGINVLSYFITERGDNNFEHCSDWSTFVKCYDKSAKYVNVENVTQVARTMNELFLQKPENKQ